MALGTSVFAVGLLLIAVGVDSRRLAVESDPSDSDSEFKPCASCLHNYPKCSERCPPPADSDLPVDPGCYLECDPYVASCVNDCLEDAGVEFPTIPPELEKLTFPPGGFPKLEWAEWKNANERKNARTQERKRMMREE